MTLNELMKEDQYKDVRFIAVWDVMDPDNITPDFADEYLETHGEYEVMDYEYLKKQDIMVVELVNLN